MSDMTEYFLDNIEDDEERLLYEKPYVSITKQCRGCGKMGLVWKKSSKGWRLAEVDGNYHNCKSTDKFERMKIRKVA